MFSSSARAWARVTPSARRPSAWKLRTPRLESRSSGGSCDAGTQISLLNGNFMSGGITPMTVAMRLLTLMDRPMTAGSLP